MKSFDVIAYYALNSVLPFKDRWTVMPLQASLPISPQELEQQWNNLQN